MCIRNLSTGTPPRHGRARRTFVVLRERPADACDDLSLGNLGRPLRLLWLRVLHVQLIVQLRHGQTDDQSAPHKRVVLKGRRNGAHGSHLGLELLDADDPRNVESFPALEVPVLKDGVLVRLRRRIGHEDQHTQGCPYLRSYAESCEVESPARESDVLQTQLRLT